MIHGALKQNVSLLLLHPDPAYLLIYLFETMMQALKGSLHLIFPEYHRSVFLREKQEKPGQVLIGAIQVGE
jgi:hypothetical protein